MVRRADVTLTSVLGAVLATAFAMVTASAPATAEPESPPCSFALTPPRVVDVSGTPMVTASVNPAGCSVAAEPTSSVACVQMEGSSAEQQCASTEGPGTAKVFYGPYRPGATYVATGRGCASTGNPPRSLCQTAGPLTATL
ncbi:MAG TPA: hypothetical protein VFL67_18895 [Mycobacterium sp.]|nr:hypothetical protein [Mycobacterium sp.]